MPQQQLIPGDEVLAALDHARDLARAGVRIFLASPATNGLGAWVPDGGTNGSGYLIPRWSAATADPEVVNRWRVGMALCAVMDGPVNAVDVDPRAGGVESAQQLQAGGAWPRSYGRQTTPSGGWHDLVAPLGVHSRDGAMPGVDVKAGDDTGGAGFIFLCPTVKLSKVTGHVAPYRWESPPDLDALEEHAGTDDTGSTLAARIAALRAPMATEADDAPHEAWDALDEAARGRVQAYLAATVRGIAEELAGAAAMPEGQRDGRGRGWQKTLADACNRLGRLARADWTPWTVTDAWEHARQVTPLPIARAVGLEATWRAQHSRRPAAFWPEALDAPLLGLIDGEKSNLTKEMLCDLAIPRSAPPAEPRPSASTATDSVTTTPTSTGSTPTGSTESTDAGPPPMPSWSPVDLAPYLDGTWTPATPTLLPRADGIGLIYPGLTHSFHGESESGKSMVLQIEAARLIRAGRPVLYVDFESDGGSVAERFLMFGCTPVQILAHLHYITPEAHPYSTEAERAAWGDMLSGSYDLAVIDGVTDSLGIFGMSSKDNDEITTWMRLLPRNIASRTGAAVVIIDHVVKNAESRGRFAIGGQAKMAALTGAGYTVEVKDPLGRGLRGVIILRVGKDRPGSVRGNAGPMRGEDRTQEVARIVVDSTGDTVATSIEPWAGHDVEPGSGKPFRLTGLMEKISRLLEGTDEPMSQTTITDTIGGKVTRARSALRTLVDEGWVHAEDGPRNSIMCHSVRVYRQRIDPLSDLYDASHGGLIDPESTPPRPTASHRVPTASRTRSVDRVPSPPSPSGGGRGQTVGGTSSESATASPQSKDADEVFCKSCGQVGAKVLYGGMSRAQCAECHGRIDGQEW